MRTIGNRIGPIFVEVACCRMALDAQESRFHEKCLTTSIPMMTHQPDEVA
jgi:hypothetical protein